METRADMIPVACFSRRGDIACTVTSCGDSPVPPLEINKCPSPDLS